MKKNLLYIVPAILNPVRPNGVGKKILAQMRSFSKAYNAELISYSDTGLLQFSGNQFLPVKSKVRLRRLALYYYVLKKVQHNKIDYIYIRYHLADPLYSLLLYILRTKGCKIVIEIPTYPYASSFDKNLNSFIKLFMDKFSYPLLKYSVGRIVTYSSDNKIFGIETIKTLNGIDFSKEKMVEKYYNENFKAINLISVSMTYSCHGYDRIIRGLANYYQKHRDVKVYFHIVGEGEEIPNLKALTSKLHMDNYVCFDGFLFGDNLDRLYSKSDLAVNSLAIHRIGLKTESTLKAKEYCAKGLPIISSYPIDSLSNNGNKSYVCLVPPNDSDVDIEKVINFYMKLQEQQNYHHCIRDESCKICDMDITLEKVRNFFDK